VCEEVLNSSVVLNLCSCWICGRGVGVGVGVDVRVFAVCVRRCWICRLGPVIVARRML